MRSGLCNIFSVYLAIGESVKQGMINTDEKSSIEEDRQVSPRDLLFFIYFMMNTFFTYQYKTVKLYELYYDVTNRANMTSLTPIL